VVIHNGTKTLIRDKRRSLKCEKWDDVAFISLYLASLITKIIKQLSGIALGYGQHDQGFESRQGLGIFTASRLTLGPNQPPTQWVQGSLSLEIKQTGRETDHCPLSSAEVKNAWSYTSIPQYAFME
jgi:hypothetical protein